MSTKVRKFADLTAAQVSSLRLKLAEFYSSPRDSYYEIADQAATQYVPNVQPFHCDLVNRIEPGMAVLELGCGTAHLCGFVEARGGTYTGMDYGDELLTQNRRRFPAGRFLKIGAPVEEKFDAVVSLYTIEHIVDPPTYLESMWNLCKPGGLIGIICPEFIDGDGLPPSFFYGRTPRRFREKIRSFAFGDAFLHLLDLFWFAPRWRSHARGTAPGAFWINLKPRILHGAEYSIDADAVHLARLKDIAWWLEHRGASILDTSRTLKGVSDTVLRYNCYVLARKPAQ